MHVFAGRLRFLDVTPRSRWLSLAGGVAIAYVFVHLLPELREAQEAVEETGAVGWLEDHVFVVALAGLISFYGVEMSSLRSRAARGGEDQPTDERAFRLSMASFAVYNAIVGYLLLGRAEEGPLSELALFTLALGVHFVVNDYGLRDHHKHAYHRVGRWLLSSAVVLGWALAHVVEVSDAAIGIPVAFIAGGVVLNTVKEELPGHRQARFWPLAAGALAYAALLQVA